MKTGRLVLTEEEYHSDPSEIPSLSRGVIKDLVMSCPLKAWFNHPKLNPDYKPKVKEAFDLGHAAHALFLQGLDHAWVVDAPDWRKAEAKEARDRARECGKYPLLAEQYQNVKAMADKAHEELWNYLGVAIPDGDAEVSYLWNEGPTWMRARLDWIKRGHFILDYKTTGTSSNPDEYSNIAGNTGLDIQDAFYTRSVHHVDGEDLPMIFMVQECSPPFICSFIQLDSMFKEMGESKVQKGIKIWERCMKTGIWPGYTNKVETIEAKPWALASWEQRLAAL